MNDKQYGKLAFIAAIALLIWWLLRRRQSQGQLNDTIEAPEPFDPITSTYAANPNQFDPPSLGTVNINIGNQGFAYLTNDYIPLFGFVGMAQGVMFQ